MRKALVAFLMCTGLVSLVSSAAADKSPVVKKMSTDDCARARAQNKTCVLDIDEGEEVVGDLPKGSEPTISIPGFTDHSSLISIRFHFIPEIVKSAEDI
jgi:hypothetical protein